MRLPLETLNTARAALGDFPYRVGDAPYKGPALFVRALQSHYIPEKAFPTISELFPASKIAEIDCGHWVVQEEPEQLRQGRPKTKVRAVGRR